MDIETAPLYEGLEGYPPVLREKLVQKYPEDGYSKAGLHAEFARIVCISAGIAASDGNFRIKSYTGAEVTILEEFRQDLGKGFCCVGHNIMDFDIPFMQRRYVINGMAIPEGMKTRGVKPWDLDGMIEDTMIMWSGTQWKYRVSLAVLCELLGIQSPKTGMDGSQVGAAYYEGRIDEIAEYCERDVVAVYGCWQELTAYGM